MTRKYTPWPISLDVLELIADNSAQRDTGVNKWGPYVEREELKIYSLPSGRVVVLHQDMSGMHGDPTEITPRTIVCGEPKRPARYLGLKEMVRYIRPKEQAKIRTELLELLSNQGKVAKDIQFWNP